MVAELVGLAVGERDDVRLDSLGVDARVGPALGDGARQSARPPMVVGQALDHGLQGHEAGRRQHADLAHAAAEPLPLGAGRRHHVGGTGEHRADGC